MSQTTDAPSDEIQALLDEMRRHEEQVRARFESIIEGEAVRQKAAGRWPFAAGWHTVDEIQRLRRQAWSRWWGVRLEASLLIGFTLVSALAALAALLRLLPR